VNALNIAEAQYGEAVSKGDLSAAIALQPAIKFNGGGHLNHSIFWTNLAPKNLGGGDLNDSTSASAHDFNLLFFDFCVSLSDHFHCASTT
jgi:Fe-Mn family superoxide dismutase